MSPCKVQVLYHGEVQVRHQVFNTCSMDAAGADSEPRMANDQCSHLNNQMTLKLNLEVSEMQEMMFLLYELAFPSRLPAFSFLATLIGVKCLQKNIADELLFRRRILWVNQFLLEEKNILKVLV